jgi:hypothetical protein
MHPCPAVWVLVENDTYWAYWAILGQKPSGISRRSKSRYQKADKTKSRYDKKPIWQKTSNHEQKTDMQKADMPKSRYTKSRYDKKPSNQKQKADMTKSRSSEPL